uniref:Uncharacterized protein n=1 Tax=Clytia hemisphaerica TaxID=252671 RepID=A0A7M5XH31_9CNID
MASKVKAQRTCTLCKNDNRNKNDFNCISQPLKEDLSAFCWILQKKMPKDFASDDSCRICNKCKKKIVRSSMKRLQALRLVVSTQFLNKVMDLFGKDHDQPLKDAKAYLEDRLKTENEPIAVPIPEFNTSIAGQLQDKVIPNTNDSDRWRKYNPIDDITPTIFLNHIFFILDLIW